MSSLGQYLKLGLIVTCTFHHENFVLWYNSLLLKKGIFLIFKKYVYISYRFVLKKNCFVVKEWNIIDKKIGDSLVDIDQLYTIIPRISHCLILLIVYTVDFDRLRLFHLYWICEL